MQDSQTTTFRMGGEFMIEYDVLDGSSKGTKKRIFQLICKYHSLLSHYQDTWCSLFKSDGYKKAEKVRAQVSKHLVRFIRKAYPGVTRWGVDFMGSKRLTDVQQCRRQKFLLKITKKDV